MESRPHRPARFADLTEIIDAAGGANAPGTRAELAATTAAAVVAAGRTRAADADGTAADGEVFVELADRVGLDTLAALWRGSDPVSLPGVLWTLYLLRQWCRSDADQVVRLWRDGEALAPADAVVAGLSDFADAAAVERFADAVLAGAFRGDLDVALERAAAFFRVVASGRRTARREADAELAGDFAERNDRAAASLRTAAGLWRRGDLH
ncbi:hypothetical protein [Jatrophihabitans fulvus]